MSDNDFKLKDQDCGCELAVLWNGEGDRVTVRHAHVDRPDPAAGAQLDKAMLAADKFREQWNELFLRAEKEAREHDQVQAELVGEIARLNQRLAKYRHNPDVDCEPRISNEERRDRLREGYQRDIDTHYAELLRAREQRDTANRARVAAEAALRREKARADAAELRLAKLGYSV